MTRTEVVGKEEGRAGSVAVRFQTAQMLESSGPGFPQAGSLRYFYPIETFWQRVENSFSKKKMATESVF